LKLARGKVIVIYTVLPIFKRLKKSDMSQSKYWVIKSTRTGVTIDSVTASIDEKRKDSPWLLPNQFKTLVAEHFNLDLKIVAQNFLVKRITKNTVDATINVITCGSQPKNWSCSFYGTFDEILARSIHKNEIIRVQTEYMLTF
jgi:hypothetical protein